MTATDNPLLTPSTLPYGIPDYAAIKPEHYVPAFQAAFAEQRQQIVIGLGELPWRMPEVRFPARAGGRCIAGRVGQACAETFVDIQTVALVGGWQ